VCPQNHDAATAVVHQQATHDFELDELLVITAITGRRIPVTIEAVNAHLVPLLRTCVIRVL
jgi:hypothetical protein